MNFMQRGGLPRALDSKRLQAALRSLLQGKVVHLQGHEWGEAQYVLPMALACGFQAAAEALAPFVHAVDVRTLVPRAAYHGYRRLLSAALQRLEQLSTQWGESWFCEDVMQDAKTVLLDKRGNAAAEYSCAESCVAAMNAAAQFHETEGGRRRVRDPPFERFVPMTETSPQHERIQRSMRAVLGWALHEGTVSNGALQAEDVPVHIVDALHSVFVHVRGGEFHGVLTTMAAAQLHVPLRALIVAHSARHRHPDYPMEKLVIAALQGDATVDVTWYASLVPRGFAKTFTLKSLSCFMTPDGMNALPEWVLPQQGVPFNLAASRRLASELCTAVAADNASILGWLLRRWVAPALPSDFEWVSPPSVRCAAALRECTLAIASEQDARGNDAVDSLAFLQLCAGVHSTHVLGALFGVDVRVPHGTPDAAMGTLDLTQPLGRDSLQALLEAAGRTPQQRSALLRDSTKGPARPGSFAWLLQRTLNMSLCHFCAVWGNQCAATEELHDKHLRILGSAHFMQRHTQGQPEAVAAALRYTLLLCTTRPSATVFCINSISKLASYTEVQQACALRSGLSTSMGNGIAGEQNVLGDLLWYHVSKGHNVPLGWLMQREDDFTKLCIAAHQWAMQRVQEAAAMSTPRDAVAASRIQAHRGAAIAALQSQLKYSQRRAMLEHRTQQRKKMGFL